MVTDADIEELEKFAGILLRSRPDVQAADVVQDAIIRAMESGTELNFLNLKPIVVKVAYGEKVKQVIGLKPNKFRTDETRKFCIECNEDLPIAAFYLRTDKDNGVQRVSGLCKIHYCQRRNKKSGAKTGAKGRPRGSKNKSYRLWNKKQSFKKQNGMPFIIIQATPLEKKMKKRLTTRIVKLKKEYNCNDATVYLKLIS